MKLPFITYHYISYKHSHLFFFFFFPLSQSLMDQYFSRMLSLMNNKDLPARIRFLLQDTVELRENNWVPRKAFIDNGPKTINQIRQDAVKVHAPSKTSD